MHCVADTHIVGAGAAQSMVGSVHADLQVVPSAQRNPFGHVAIVPGEHIPAPSQWSACFSVFPEHITGVPHVVLAGCSAHVPLALHSPVFPQGGPAVQVDAGTGASPLFRLWQATAPAQVAQPMQVVGIGVVQVPPVQVLAGVNTSPAAVTTHDAAGQAMLAGTAQTPMPLQNPAGILERPSVLHVATAQDVSEPTLAHAPPAAQYPVYVMQVGVAGVVGHSSGSAVPALTAEQVPSWPLLLQAMQVPVQAELQQTPSTQFPDRQSVPTMHAKPSPSFSPHWLVFRLQVTPTQSLSPVHVVAHCHGFVASHLL